MARKKNINAKETSIWWRECSRNGIKGPFLFFILLFIVVLLIKVIPLLKPNQESQNKNTQESKGQYSQQVQTQTLFGDTQVVQNIIQPSEYDIQNKKHTDNAKAALQQYYIYQSRGDYDKAVQLYDKIAKNDDNVIEFFNDSRLRRFNKGIDGSRRIVNMIQENENLRDDDDKRTRRAFIYQLQYSINGNIYTEDRETVMIYRKDENTRQINKIECTTKYCVNNPFFAFDKFGL